MEINTITAVIAALLSVIALLLIVIRWVMDSKKPPVNGNGNGTLKLADIQDALTVAVQGFRESHLENKMRQMEIISTLNRIESTLGSCSDILKTLPKRNTD